MGKLKKYTNEETDKVNIFESVISQISNDSNHNIIFIVDWLEGDNVRIEFNGISNVTFDLMRNLSYDKELIGTLEIRGFSYKRENGLYIVQFNFDTVLLGVIRIVCQSFSFIVPSEPITVGGNDNMII